MKLTQEFQVAKPVDVVWEFFQDIPSVAACMPGAELGDRKEDGPWAGKLTVKLGPMSTSFEGEATIIPDPEARSAHIDGKGVDRRGGSRGQVAVDYALAAADGGTRVTVDADITLSGAIAQFGRTGLIDEMSSRLIGQFVDCLERRLSAETTAEAREIKAPEVKGISLFFSALGSTIANFFRRLFRRGRG